MDEINWRPRPLLALELQDSLLSAKQAGKRFVVLMRDQFDGGEYTEALADETALTSFLAKIDFERGSSVLADRVLEVFDTGHNISRCARGRCG